MQGLFNLFSLRSTLSSHDALGQLPRGPVASDFAFCSNELWSNPTGVVVVVWGGGGGGGGAAQALLSAF